MRILYASHGGTTRRIARRLATVLGCPAIDVAALPANDPPQPQPVVFCCPTYGDGELETGMERFLVASDWSAWTGQPYALLEVGVYTGYEDFGHGLCPIFRRWLIPAGLVEAWPPLAVDAVPWRDEGPLLRWAEGLRGAMARP